MNNDNVTLEALREDLTNEVSHHSVQDEVYLIQDTTFYCFENVGNKSNSRFSPEDEHIGTNRIQGNRGIFAHPTLALDSRGNPVGFTDLQLYHLPVDRLDKHERDYKNQAIEDKHSYRWISSIHNSTAHLPNAKRITVIADREADIYQLFAQDYDDRVDLLIRCNYNRRTTPEDGTVKDRLSKLAWQGTHVFTSRSNASRGAAAQQQTLSVRFAQFNLKRPTSVKTKVGKADYPASVPIWIIEAKELDPVDPDSAIHWYLYTTRPIETLEDAIKGVQDYSKRWWIEDFFRLTKNKGFELESSGFKTGLALKRLIHLVFKEAIKVLALRQGRMAEHQPASEQFDELEIQLLELLEESLSGRGKSQRCPFKKRSLAWAAWLIARQGGWTPRDMKKRPPGVITFIRGYKSFSDKVIGFRFFANAKTKPT